MAAGRGSPGPDYYGAFKLNYPGQDRWLWSLYYQFQTARTPANSYVYLAGDSVSWSGGWTEGALETGINAICAVAGQMAATFPNGSPLDQDAYRYSYGQPPGARQPARQPPTSVKPPLRRREDTDPAL